MLNACARKEKKKLRKEGACKTRLYQIKEQDRLAGLKECRPFLDGRHLRGTAWRSSLALGSKCSFGSAVVSKVLGMTCCLSCNRAGHAVAITPPNILTWSFAVSNREAYKPGGYVQ